VTSLSSLEAAPELRCCTEDNLIPSLAGLFSPKLEVFFNKSDFI